MMKKDQINNFFDSILRKKNILRKNKLRPILESWYHWFSWSLPIFMKDLFQKKIVGYITHI